MEQLPSTVETPLAHVHAAGIAVELKRSDIPRATRDAIKNLQSIENSKGFAEIGIEFALFATALVLLIIVNSLFMRCIGVAIMACAMMRGIFIMHEGAHRMLLKDGRLNRLFGFIFGIPFGVSLAAFRHVHDQHHAFERTDRDPDNIAVISELMSIPLPVMRWLTLFFASYAYILQVAVTGIVHAVTKRKPEILIEYAVIGIIFTCLGSILSFNQILWFWLMPFIISVQIINIRSLAEHELTSGHGVFGHSRTTISNRFVSFLMANGNYHIEHHLYPRVPQYNLRRMHALLLDEYKTTGAAISSGYLQFLADLLKTNRMPIYNYRAPAPKSDSHVQI